MPQSDEITLPGWTPLDHGRAVRVCAQLSRELSRGHDLHGVRVKRAILSRDADDDFLFEVDLPETPFVVVHLGWETHKEPGSPAFQLYRNVDELRQDEAELMEMLEDEPSSDLDSIREYFPCMDCSKPAQRTHTGVENSWYECANCGRKFGIDWSGEQG